MDFMGSPRGISDKEPACQSKLDLRDAGWSLGLEDPLLEGVATHSSIPAWRIP